MTHHENNILQKLFDGTLNKKERFDISENLKNIKSQEEEKTMKEQSKKFDADLAWEKVHNKIKNEHSSIPEKVNKHQHLFNPARIAATILLFLGLSVSGYFIFTSNSDINIHTENKVKEITLPDSSVITLNEYSEITYPKKFTQKSRNVRFKGEAFFNITKNPQKPFIINTDNLDIKVLGTSFNVNTENKKTEVIVKTGKVEVKSPENKKIVLIPGEKGIFNAGKLNKSKNNNPNYLAWKTLFFTYENTPLNKIVSDINKVYKVNIIFDDAEIGMSVFGKVTFDNKSISEIVQIICKNFNLKSTGKGKNIILSY